MQSVTNDSQEAAPGMEIWCCVRSQHDKRGMDFGTYAGPRFFETVILKSRPARNIFRFLHTEAPSSLRGTTARNRQTLICR